MKLKNVSIVSLLALAILLASPLSLTAMFSVNVYPDSAPEGGTSPKLYVYLPPAEKATGISYLICPGGSYSGVNVGVEGDAPAKWLNTLGIAGIVLDYRIGLHPIPMEDAMRAMQVVRARASEWGLDTGKIGIMGFSAGGHLASTVCTHFNDYPAKTGDYIDLLSCRPRFAILIYPVISFYLFGPPYKVVGNPPDTAIMNYLANERHVSPQTPPTFICVAADDGLKSSSVLYHDSCVSHSVPSELIIYPHGGHGFFPYDSTISMWADDGNNWMYRMGIYNSIDSSIFIDTSVLDFYANSNSTFPLDPIVKIINAGVPMPALSVVPDSAWLHVSVSGSGNSQIIHHTVDYQSLEADKIHTAGVTIHSSGHYDLKYVVKVRAYARTPVSIKLFPDTLVILQGAAGNFKATVLDDRNVGYVSSPAPFNWSVSGGGSLDSTGRFVSNTTPGDFQVVVALRGYPNLTDTAIARVGSGFATNLNNWSAQGGTWSTVGNGYQGSNGNVDVYSLSTDTASNFTYEADINLVSGTFAALVFRSTAAPGSGAYAVNLNTSAGRIRLYKNPFSSLGTYDVSLTNGVWYHLKVVAAGQNLKVFFNGSATPVIDVNDNSFSTGRFGLNVCSSTTIFQNVFINNSVSSEKIDLLGNNELPNILVSPNPFASTIKISLSGLTSVQSVSIYDVHGKLVTILADYRGGSKKGVSEQIHWKTSELASGIYVIQVAAKGMVLNKKISLLH